MRPIERTAFESIATQRVGEDFKVGGPFTSRMTDVQDNREKAHNSLHTCEKNSFKVTLPKCKS